MSGLTAFVREIFQCQEDVAHCIAKAATERGYRPGAAIVRQGDQCDETFLLTVGRARASAVGRDGASVLLHDFAPGDLFGATVRPTAPSDVDVTALGVARVAVFIALDFLRLMERHNCIGMVLSRLLLARLKTANKRLVDRNTLSAVGRIHAELLRRAEPNGWSISPPPVLAALALELQTTRETVSRTVSALERRGLVRRTAEALIIVAPRRLESLVD
ncbi:Crp/Fnr family transcriptional regulator [Caulobacter sp. RL271]|jgi:CRP-like cAMP-binding protein|uniref:Crp/Fnr family transcriptional regulator n=1 Tax=Caulobacter segnis TaxID=88688 RepID=A0ABY4ZZM0_9CAUL|nr:Crp/Fnr family transcriptional regulator [Caulobacter segnis]USQ97371.1 Crp/Fnr family transcriptional regulator [Caulobacter segnis]